MDILQNNIIPKVRPIYPESVIICLVKDNNLIYKAIIVQLWLKRIKNIIVINWPVLSPDFNIIENILN